MRTGGVGVAVLMVSLAMGARGLRGGNPTGADALWDWAESEAAGDLSAPAYLDAARELSAVRPWQPGFTSARERLRRIEAARRAQLAAGPGKG